MERGRVLALEYLKIHYEYCKTTVLSGDYTDKTSMEELKEAIKWVETI